MGLHLLKRRGGWIAGIAAAIGAGALLAGALASAQEQSEPVRPAYRPAATGGSLASFGSGRGIASFFLRGLRQRQRRGQTDGVASPAAPPPAAEAAETMTAVTGAGSPSPSITNTQEADVDEGGIVKVRGDMLVILRRGRLFTVSLAGGGMRPVDSINAFPPGVSGQGDWYDEMLLSGDRVDRRRLQLCARRHRDQPLPPRRRRPAALRGRLSSALERLLFLAQLCLAADRQPADLLHAALSRLGRGSARGAARHAQMGAAAMTSDRRSAGSPARARSSSRPRCATTTGDEIEALHSVTNCDLVAPELDLLGDRRARPGLAHLLRLRRTRSICGSSDFRRRAAPGRATEAFVYRLPFGRERPSAIGARGRAGRSILVPRGPRRRHAERAGARRAAAATRWAGRRSAAAGSPCCACRSPRSATARARRRRRAIAGCRARRGDEYSFHNRFVGDHVLYGAGAFGEGGKARLVVASIRGLATELIC